MSDDVKSAARLPCPFCGSRKTSTIGGGNHQWVECTECGASGPITDEGQRSVAKGVMEAERLWNQRAAVAEADRLRAALRPFAAVTIPDSWPAGCVVDWIERVGFDGKRFASVNYLGIDAQGGPSVGDYRTARAALAESR